MSKTTIEVAVACDEPGIPEVAEIHRWVERALEWPVGRDRHPGHQDVEVVVRVVSGDEMRALNLEYRDADKPTNVLSFPAGAVDGLPEGVTQALGDIVVCASVVRDEADAQHKPIADHWAHMLVHGSLHLLGFDHQVDADAREMEALELEILASGGIADPYIGQ